MDYPVSPGRPAGAADGASRLERYEVWTREHRWRIDALIAAGVAATAGLATLVAGFGGYSGTTRTQVLSIAALMHVALAWRRTAPVGSFLVVTAAHGAQLLAITDPLASNLVFPLAVYALARYARRPWPWIGLGLGIVGSFAGGMSFTGYRFNVVDVNQLLYTLVLGGFFAACVVATFTMGAFAGVRAQYVQALEERALRAEQEREAKSQRAVAEERARVAREMHDVVAHSLSVIVVQAQGGTYAARTDPAAALGVLETIASTGRAALVDMRGLLGVLRGRPDGTGTSAAPQPGLADLPALLEGTRSAGLQVSFDQIGPPRELTDTAALAVYRVVQESLTNTLKHAGADACASTILTWERAELVVAVEDDGHGATRGIGADSAGHGLVGMRERMAVFGGSVDFGPRPGGGFRVRAHLPYARAVTAVSSGIAAGPAPTSQSGSSS